MSFKLDFTSNSAYFKELLKLIKEFTSTPCLRVANGTSKITALDTGNVIVLHATLLQRQNKLNSFFGGGKPAAAPTAKFDLTFDVEEAIAALTSEINQSLFTETTAFIGSKPVKIYPTFTVELPTPVTAPTCSMQINTNELYSKTNEMEFRATFEANNSELKITHYDGLDETLTKTVPITNFTGQPTKSIYSSTYLNCYLKPLCTLTDTITLSMAYDNPLIIEANLKLSLGKLTIYQAPIIEVGSVN